MAEIALDSPAPPLPRNALGKWAALAFTLMAIASFHIAYTYRPLAGLMALFLWAMLELGRISTTRSAFWTGLLIGLAIYIPHLSFFWQIFYLRAIALWVILALWLALFLLLSRSLRDYIPHKVWLISLPIFWTGLEYFRCETPWLRFSWLTPGLAFATPPVAPPIAWLGVYGLSFTLMAAAALIRLLPWRIATITALLLLPGFILLANAMKVPESSKDTDARLPYFVGIQLEQPNQEDVLLALERAIGRHPQTELLILPEFTLTTPPSQKLLQWCAQNHRHVIVGGIKSAGSGQWRSTAFIIDADGKIIFEQARAICLPFLADGLPAESQGVWQSPWGKIAVCLGFDLSYSRAIDPLIAQSAQLIITLTMESAYWDPKEHELHALVAPARAAEYHIPIIRITNAGISQFITSDGFTKASAPLTPPPADDANPQDPEEITGRLPLTTSISPHIPWDRYLAPVCTLLTALLALFLIFKSFRKPHIPQDTITVPAP